MNYNDWMNDPALVDFPKEKLAFLENLFLKASGLTQKEMMPFLLSLAAESKKHNISFQKDEMKLIYATLQKYASKEDLEKMEKLSSFIR